jgi:hypothetical protein
MLHFSLDDLQNCKNRIINESTTDRRLKDNDILMILNIFITNLTKTNCIIIDSCFTPIIFNLLEKNEYDNRNLKIFIDNFKECKEILVLPLFYQNHWSLSIFIKHLNCLICFDSINNYHFSFIEKISEYLNEKLFIKTYQIETIIQKGYWECGYYLLMFFYLFLTIYDHHKTIDQKILLKLIEIKCLYDKINIDTFILSLIKIIDYYMDQELILHLSIQK